MSLCALPGPRFRAAITKRASYRGNSGGQMSVLRGRPRRVSGIEISYRLIFRARLARLMFSSFAAMLWL